MAPCPFKAPPKAEVESALARTTGVAYPKLYANRNIAPTGNLRRYLAVYLQIGAVTSNHRKFFVTFND